MNDATDQIVVADTDIGFDADDAVAIAILARAPIDTLLVATADETGGRRARLLRRLLGLLGRDDVTVFTGLSCPGNARRFVLDDELTRPAPPSGPFLDELISILDQTSGPILWIGLGPLTNLAWILTARPALADRIRLVQMGGWLDRYRDRSRSSHNFHTDPAAAGSVLRMLHRPLLVLSDHADPSIQLGPDSPIAGFCRSATAPAWARLVGANLTEWHARRGYGSMMMDPLTVATALQVPVTTTAEERVRIAADARLTRDPAGRRIEVTTSVDYPKYLAWLDEAITG
ncbi:nucleoside hydrolase [Nocardia cyriacigeorgica]|uniref:Pyrimidine-specific ribonucleoside hydrolase rihA n=1 Tax=Nocardia cyriacigeorgica TaxID=135487 RepID=A0A4U8VSA5_9NOCA|nr:nucleoside hydrolase [Nocardia cyriacigeorgica]VFA96311.1 Pyrimidine-specific ribonucleoside hydrolase rihA [Nocardia cyriacigeorgica]